MTTLSQFTEIVALTVFGLTPSSDSAKPCLCAFAQEPIATAVLGPQEALARLCGLWTDARGLALALENSANKHGRLIADDEGRLFVDWTEPVYEEHEPGGGLIVAGSKRYVLMSDGARVTEFDGRSRRTFSRPLDGRARARSSQLAYMELPFPGDGGYFAALLRDVDGASSRMEAADAGRSQLVLPLTQGAQASRVLEYRVLFDAAFTRIEVVRVVGHNERGPVGMRWTMHSVETFSEPPAASAFQFDLPEDAIEVTELAFHMPLVGDVVPEFSVETLGGDRFSLDRTLATHKAVLVQFWGSWCGPCIREFPHIEALATEHGTRGLAVLGLACDDTLEAARLAAERAKVTYPIAIDAARGRGLEARFGVRAFPTLLLIGEGRRVLWHSHARLGDVEGALERVLPR